MLGLLGFHDELEGRAGAPNGSVHDAVRAAGEPDEAALVGYLDAALPLVGWTSAVPWPLTRGVREPEPPAVMTRAEFDAREAARARERPGP
ncbi:hypothetical protein ACIRS1_19120 [Kitasatospora sp. NPDC101176]|uniref:hypothetical protein n=1 Tax=Kitasatospora sp. NPDC101176 TaxID=3364099 RepID=UPI0038233EA6